MEVIDDIPYLRTGSALCQPQKAGGRIRVPTPMATAMPAAAPLPDSAREADGGVEAPAPVPAREVAEGAGEPLAAPEVEEEDEETRRDLKKDAVFNAPPLDPQALQ